MALSALSVLLVACSSSTRAETSITTPTSALGTSTPTTPSPSTPLSTSTSTSAPSNVATSPPVVTTSDPAGLTLVALGDSIPFNSNSDCSGCVGYVDQYKDAIAKATGKSVKVANLSSHNGLTSAGLLHDLNDPNVRASVAAADVITVSIGFNDAPMLVNDDPCDGAAGDTKLELYTDACINDWADTFARRFKIILDDIKDLRGDKPTLLTVINIYDQWLGFSQNSADINAHIAVVKTLLERQNAGICRVAADHGALCADLHSAFNGPNHDQPSGTLLGPDYAHPSQAGNDLIAKTLAQLGFTPLA